MMPEYYEEHFNVFLAFSPIARTDNKETPLFRVMGDDLDDLKYLIVDVLGMYNMFDPEDLGKETSLKLCKASPEFCAAVFEALGDPDPSVDNLDRIETFITHFPSGTGWRNFFHYARNSVEERF